MKVSGKKMRRDGGSSKGPGWRKIMLAVCCCALLLTVGQAQTGAREEGEARDTALELKLSAYESKVCAGSSLTLSLEITNTSREVIKLHKQSLWREFSYSSVDRNSNRTSIGCGGGDARAEDSIVLEPGAQYRDTHTYSLEWNDLFQNAGRYRISTRLSYYFATGKYGSGGGSSNEVEFEVYNCAAK